MNKFYTLLESINPSRYPDIKKLKPSVKEDQIYNFVQDKHHTPDDFYDGDLGDRIEQYKIYKLITVNLNELDLEEWYYEDDYIEDYMDEYIKGSDFPPIILQHDYSIIDGTHRANAAYRLGHTHIKAYIGVK